MSAIVLPSKLSELALLGLASLAKVEAQPGVYRVSMGVWHEPDHSGRCYVCFAGAVMAMVMGVNSNAWASPGDMVAPNRGRLLALDALRCGDLSHAAFLAYLPGELQLQARRIERPLPRYEQSSALFRSAMYRQAIALRDVGL